MAEVVVKQHNDVLKHLLHDKFSGKMKKKSAMLDNVTGPQQRHLHMYPIILTSSCRRHNTLSILRVKTFQNIVRQRKR